MPDRRFNRRRPARRGAAMVELAVILPLFIMVILGQLEAARLAMVLELLNNAAREGCRAAVINGNTQTDVQNAVNAVLANSGITVTTPTPTPSNWATSTGGTKITLSLSVSYKSVAWWSAPLYFTVKTIAASATMSSERP